MIHFCPALAVFFVKLQLPLMSALRACACNLLSVMQRCRKQPKGQMQRQPRFALQPRAAGYRRILTDSFLLLRQRPFVRMCGVSVRPCRGSETSTWRWWPRRWQACRRSEGFESGGGLLVLRKHGMLLLPDCDSHPTEFWHVKVEEKLERDRSSELRAIEESAGLATVSVSFPVVTPANKDLERLKPALRGHSHTSV